MEADPKPNAPKGIQIPNVDILRYVPPSITNVVINPSVPIDNKVSDSQLNQSNFDSNIPNVGKTVDQSKQLANTQGDNIKSDGKTKNQKTPKSGKERIDPIMPVEIDLPAEEVNPIRMKAKTPFVWPNCERFCFWFLLALIALGSSIAAYGVLSCPCGTSSISNPDFGNVISQLQQLQKDVGKIHFQLNNLEPSANNATEKIIIKEVSNCNEQFLKLESQISQLKLQNND